MTHSEPVTDQGVGKETSVFFSYSREDQAKAVPIIRLIEQAGFAVWWDGLLEGGERFSRATEDALDRAQAVVVLWSKASIDSHWVRDEATRGRDRRILIPLSLDGSEPPLGFGQFQVINLAGAKINAKGKAMARVVHAVAALHGQDAPRVYSPSSAALPLISRRMAMAGGATGIVFAGGIAAWLSGLLGGTSDGINRIAVLPFRNLGGDPKQAYLAEGLCAEIRSMLAQNGALQVVGQASSEAFGDGKLDSIVIAKKLTANFLLDGAVQVAGGVIRITAELIDGKTGVNRLPQRFEKPMDNILLVQQEIAGAISAKLTNSIASVGTTKLALGGTANASAFDHYLRGKDLYAHAKDEAEEREAITQFDAAIAADPNFASAHTGRAKSLAVVAGQYGSAAEITQYNDAALISARRAIELAPKLASAHSTLALLLFQNLDIKAARAPFNLSRKLGEGEAPIMALFAYYCAANGRDKEAVSAVDRALLLDPLNALVQRIAGSVHYAARRFAETIRYVHETIKLSPDLADTHARIGMALLAQNKNREALSEFVLDTHKWSKLAGIAIAQNRLGNEKAAKSAMAGLTADTDTVSLYQQGQVLAQWNDLDAAVAVLVQAREQRDAGMTALRYDPMLDPLRKLPRFILLLKSLGFD
jgi:TolB-like protein/tetratricopeptide (TPR) repeat protein